MAAVISLGGGMAGATLAAWVRALVDCIALSLGQAVSSPGR